MGVWAEFIRFFSFSHREVWGIKILFCLIVVGLCAPGIFRLFAPEDAAVPPSMRAELEAFLAAQAQQEKSADEPDAAAARLEAAEYFVFDPNTLDRAGWVRLGFSDRQVNMIVNYRARGGRFHRKEDLQKIYAIEADDYQRISDYVVIPKAGTDRSKYDHSSDAKPDDAPPRARTPAAVPDRELVIELNTADSLRLQLLPGIGPAFASRIVRYRDRLGGFHELEQLLDVYGMDTDRIDRLAAHVRVDPAQARGLRINEADLETLGRHPLIGFKLAGILLRYRDHHGAFHSADDIRKLDVFDEEKFKKLEPYLIF